MLVERRKTRPRYVSLDDITTAVAFGIGCFQCLALWPGFSRSASTIMGGLLLGARRELAAQQKKFASMLSHEFRTPLSTIDLLTILGVALITSKGAHGVPGSAIVILAATLGAIPAIPAIRMVPMAGRGRSR